jgi:HK97 family phage portal protein
MEKLLAAYRGWVYKAVTVIANRIAEIRQTINDVRPIEDGTEERVPIPQHPYYDLMGSGGQRRPNPMTTSYNLRKLTDMDLELVGNAYWFKVRDGAGIPRELWRLRPDKMKPVPDQSTGLLLGWVWQNQYAGGQSVSVPFLRSEVVHFMYPHPLGDPYTGMGPLRAAAVAFDIDEANRRYQREFFDKGAQVSMVLSTEQKLDEGEVDRILDDFEVKHSGLDNAWLPMVLGGGLQATPMTAMNKDLEALGLMEFTRDDLLSTFGVPKTKVGLGENINQANAQALDVMFNRETINPRLKNIEETIEGELLVDYPQPPEPRRIELDHDNPVPEDREFELKETETLHRAGIITTNMALQRHDMPMFEGPAEGSYGDKVHVGIGTELIDPTAEEEEEPVAPPPPPPDEDAEEFAADLLDAAGLGRSK